MAAKNGITWPISRSIQAQLLSGLNSNSWPKVQKSGISWPKVQILQIDYIGLWSDLSVSLTLNVKASDWLRAENSVWEAIQKRQLAPFRPLYAVSHTSARSCVIV